MFIFIHLDYSCTTLEEINLPEIKCLNIENLVLTLPYDDHFRFIVPKFDNLIYLQIRMITWGNNENDLFQLQTILDQSPRLYYLKFHSWSIISSKTEYKNKKVIRYKTFFFLIFSIFYYRIQIQLVGKCHHFLFEVHLFVILIYKDLHLKVIINIIMNNNVYH